jgi:tRNA (mo5U34)-methyltransferase
MMTMTDDEVRAAVAQLNWFQSFDLRPGLTTPGVHSIPRHLQLIQLPESLAGMSVCDLGTNAGGVAFEAEHRGAAHVVAIDHPDDWGYANLGQNGRACFDLARRATGSRVVEPRAFDLESDWPADLGTFDVVLALGIVYHAKGPVKLIERCFEATAPGGLLILETHLSDLPEDRPLCEYLQPRRLNNDPSNYFGPNASCVRAWLTAAGFVDVQEVGRYPYGFLPGWRAAFHARKAS